MRAALEPPPGLVGDDTSFSSAGRWRDGSNVRFWLGRAQVIGGWERLSTGVVPGVCRSVFAWTDRNAALNAAFGTHRGLMVWRDELADVTPTLGRPSITLSNPMTVAGGSATVKVRHPGHGLTTGDAVVLSGAKAVGRITPGATIQIAAPIAHETGFAWQTSVSVDPATQELRLYEDDRELGPAGQLHADIRSLGRGRYSHWNNGQTFVVIFSTSDNTDPNTNGRTYSLRPAYEVTVVDEDHYAIEHTSTADISKTLGNNPLAVISGSAVVTVTDAGHGLPTGLEITVSGAAAVGGITPNGRFPIEVVDANTYKYTFKVNGAPSNATSNASGGGASVVVTVPTGGGGEVTVAPQNAFPTGSIHGTGGAGFGTGTWSTGRYSAPSEEDYFPRTWSFSALGQWLIANPRGGAIYAWKNDAGTPAAPVLNAPRQVICGLVGPNDEIFALGCNEETSGVFNPLCIRHSGLRDVFGPNEMVWRTSSATTAREYVLNGGGRIVAGRVLGRHMLVWTNHALFLGQFVGQPDQVWRFDRVGQNCGLIGPNAVVTVGSSAYWLAPDLQFRRYDLGGSIDILPCPIRKDLADNMAAVQGDKIVASSNSTYGEVRFDYPDRRDGDENSRYIAAAIAALRVAPEQAWHRGRMRRSAMADAGPAEFPIGVGPAYEPGQPILIEYEGGVATITSAGATLGLAGGAWAGRHIHRVRAGALTAELGAAMPSWLSCRRASAGFAKTNSGALIAFAPDAPRRTDRGLLVEGTATNLFWPSEPTLAHLYDPAGVSLAAAPTNAPFAAATWLNIAPKSGGDSRAQLAVNIRPLTTYRMSAFVEMDDQSQPLLSPGHAGAGDFLFLFAGTLLPAQDIAYERMSGAVWRVSATYRTPATLLNTMCGLYRQGASGSKMVKVTGLQIEEGEVTSSYISTHGGSGIRAADVVTADLAASVAYWHEKGQSADGGPIAWHIETADQYISEDQAATVLGVWPDFADQVRPVTVEVTSRLKPQGDERTQGPLTMDPGQDKVDLRLSGRLFRVKLAGASSPTFMRLGKLALEFRPSGRR